MTPEQEKQFDERFGCLCDGRLTPDHTQSTVCRGAFDLDELKEFYSSLLADQRKELVAEIKALQSDIGEENKRYLGLQDAINLINKDL